MVFLQVFQRRLTGAVPFHDVSWQLYQHGFGNVSHEYWLGNDVVHVITSAGTDYLLRVELTNAHGSTRVAEYSDFRLDSETDNYALRLGLFLATSNVGESV